MSKINTLFKSVVKSEGFSKSDIRLSAYDDSLFVVNEHKTRFGTGPAALLELARDIADLMNEAIPEGWQDLLTSAVGHDDQGYPVLISLNRPVTWRDLTRPDILQTLPGMGQYMTDRAHNMILNSHKLRHDSLVKKLREGYKRFQTARAYHSRKDDSFRAFLNRLGREDRQDATKLVATVKAELDQVAGLYSYLQQWVYNHPEKWAPKNKMHRIVNGLYFLFGDSATWSDPNQPLHISGLRVAFDGIMAGTDILPADTRRVETTNNGEYYVMTKAEMVARAKEQITESLFVFRPEYLAKYANVSASVLQLLCEQCEHGNEGLAELVDHGRMVDDLKVDDLAGIIGWYGDDVIEAGKYLIWRA